MSADYFLTCPTHKKAVQLGQGGRDPIDRHQERRLDQALATECADVWEAWSERASAAHEGGEISMPVTAEEVESMTPWCSQPSIWSSQQPSMPCFPRFVPGKAYTWQGIVLEMPAPRRPA